MSSTVTLDEQLRQAAALDGAGQTQRAEAGYRAIAAACPGHPAATSRLADMALERGEVAQAIELLQHALRLHGSEAELALQLSFAYLAAGDGINARRTLQALTSLQPAYPEAWLLLSELQDRMGQQAAALQAAYQAVMRAQKAGRWIDEQTTPPHMTASVLRAVEKVRSGRRTLVESAYADLRGEHGNAALQRVDRALRGYLGDETVRPDDARPRPRFLYFPDLPQSPYLDPYLQPWAEPLRAAYPQIKAEALQLLTEGVALPGYLDLKDSQQLQKFLAGQDAEPSWEAFFFYRRGKRYDDNHARCPHTSALLESIELCRIDGQAPEICFSVLRAGTHILPHYGVTNTRVVMHLPLVVPPDCALNIVGVGAHAWREGELMMFDDTYQHEAWNWSDATRVILLMDCWNPHLTAVERIAVKQLVEMISSLSPAAASPYQA